MRVLIAGQAFFRPDNGQAVFTVNLAKGLAQAGHAVLVMAPSPTGRAYRQHQPGLILQTVPALPLGYNLNITALTGRVVTRTLLEFGPDVVHLQDHYFLSRSVLRVARQHQLKVVGTNHFLPENLIDNLPIPGWLHGLARRWLWRTMLDVYQRLDGVTAPTQTAVAILNRQSLPVPSRAISCGVDVDRFKPRPALDRVALRRRYGLAPDKVLLLYVGRIDREKRLDLMARALAQLDRAEIQWAVVGQGSYLNGLKQLCQDLGLEGRVVFTGFVPAEELPLLLNSADIFVMPGHAELQSIATLEAMSSGLPVLAARACALPELVTSGVNGDLFAADDAEDAARSLAALLDKRSSWAEMGQASLTKAASHAQEHTIRAYADWYQQVCQVTKADPVDYAVGIHSWV